MAGVSKIWDREQVWKFGQNMIYNLCKLERNLPLGNISISKQMQKTHYYISRKFKSSMSRTKWIYRAGEIPTWQWSVTAKLSISEPFVLEGTSWDHPVHVPVQAEAEQAVHGHTQLGFQYLQPSLLGNLIQAHEHPHSRTLYMVFIQRYRDSLEEPSPAWLPSCSVWSASAGRTWFGTHLQLCSPPGYSTTVPESPAAGQAIPCSPHQPGATALKGQAVPNRAAGGTKGQPSLSQTLPNSRDLQDSDHKLWKEQ